MAPRKRHPQGQARLPEIFFHAIANFLPALNQIAQECDISIGQWVILFHLRHAGVLEGGQATMLRQDLTDLLVKRGFGEANIVRLLNSLEDKDLVRRVSLTHLERERLFKSSQGGNRQAVVLQLSGDTKIDLFKERLTAHFESWRSEQSVMLQKALDAAQGAGLQFAEWFSKGTLAKSP